MPSKASATYFGIQNFSLLESGGRNVFELAKHNQLEKLQWKVEYLSNEANMLELEKEKSVFNGFQWCLIPIIAKTYMIYG
ncbi:MAG: hypothetical protein WAM14_06075 [Candidatus Nitrosopolaris sp.]